MNLSKGISLIPIFSPVNFFIIGDSMGVGFQFPLVRMQETYLGWSTIFFWQEFWYIANGVIAGRSAFSILLWLGGVILLAAVAFLLFINRGYGRRGLTVFGLGCALLMISTMVQYGPLFHGPAGIAIPIGLPLLIVIGYFFWKEVARSDTAGEINDDLSESNSAPVAAPLAASASTDADAND
jgi:peptidoglycan/LPS O-acetylase OafA/YrhL